MLEGFSAYIKSMVFFLIFSSFIGIILPSGKYKNYISMVLGFLLLFIAAKPLGTLFHMDDLASRVNEAIGQVMTDTEEYPAYADEQTWRDGMIAQSFNAQMQSQIAPWLVPYGYTLDRLAADISADGDAVTGLNLWLSKADTPPGKSGPGMIGTVSPVSVEIAPVTVEKADSPESAPDMAEPPDSVSARVKKQISDFYNIPRENIHIHIQKEAEN